MITEDHETVNTFGGERFLPPETSTPMPPMLARVYIPAYGWPGLPDERPTDDPGYSLYYPKIEECA